MKTHDIRTKYLAFFEKKGHKHVKSDSLIPHNDPTLLFTGAGMNQFKEYFMGLKKDFTRATTAQKCLRTGDLENVGKTPYHHTFFEMLGNFSFGDYFKEDAIKWAWEFLTQEMKIPVEKLRVSVHRNDDEAYEIWNKKIGLAPEIIYKFGDKDNFWPSNAPTDGPNGPCGPCSEIFYDQGRDVGCKRKECSPECDCGRFAEIWNLVFTQYERKEGGVLETLPMKNIDTGMGLERIACVLQGKKVNYEIDIFEKMISYLTEKCSLNIARDEKRRASIYAISDHVRAAVFCIADGAYPSNEGRGYVIRKLIRRSVWHGRLLQIEGPFLAELVPLVIDEFKKVYPELEENRYHVREVVIKEEERFLETIESGLLLLNEVINNVKENNQTVIAGEQVFRLYDTYGFPEELTRLIAEKEGLSIDLEQFEKCMNEQREKAKQATAISDAIFASSDLEKHLATLSKTHFVGYEFDHSRTDIAMKVISLFKGSEVVDTLHKGDIGYAIFDKTPFYGEAGGQVGDRGYLCSREGKRVAYVSDTQKKDDIYYHQIEVIDSDVCVGDQYKPEIPSRLAIMANHTATHLLQGALRAVLGAQVRQLGSQVTSEKLRFDFSYHKAMTSDEKERVEKIVNNKIVEGINLEVAEDTLEAAKEKGALAFFGDKYGEKVRVVSIGEYSVELCGGTHVKNTKDIGLFRIISEASSASGIRRIEALTGEKARAYEEELKKKDQEREEKEMQKRKDKDKRKEHLSQLTSQESIEKLLQKKKQIEEYTYLLFFEDGLDQGALRQIYDVIKQRTSKTICIFVSELDEKLAVVVALTKDLSSSDIDANAIVKEINKIIQGSGGGKKLMAFSGSKLVDKKCELIEKIPDILTQIVKY